MGDSYRFEVAPGEAGLRLDVALARHVAGRTRSALAELVRDGHVRVGGSVASKPGRALRPGEQVEVDLLEPAPSRFEPEAIPLDVLHEDDDLLVVNKPAGLVVHPAAGHEGGTLVNALLGRALALAPADDVRKPGIVHRLDKDTSGCLVVAKTPHARESLEAQFKDRQVRKIYLTVVHGMTPLLGEILAPIGRDPRQRKRMSVSARRSRSAVTRFRRLENLGEASLLEVVIATGRTHQIRVHLASIGHPVVGDAVYGGQKPRSKGPLAAFGRQALHAAELAFRHPRNGVEVVFRAPLPIDMEELLIRLRQLAQPAERARKGRGSAMLD